MIVEYQEHTGAVDLETSLKVQYGYSEMAGGANHSRLETMTYPDGRVLHLVFSAGLDDSISRQSQFADDDGMGEPGQVLEEFSYLGLGTVVVRAHPEADVELTYIGDPGDAGDQYAGLDRFGRVVEQRLLRAGVSMLRAVRSAGKFWKLRCCKPRGTAYFTFSFPARAVCHSSGPPVGAERSVPGGLYSPRRSAGARLLQRRPRGVGRRLGRCGP